MDICGKKRQRRKGKRPFGAGWKPALQRPFGAEQTLRAPTATALRSPYSTKISTRRLAARPCGVALSATGMDEPKEVILALFAGMPRFNNSI